MTSRPACSGVDVILPDLAALAMEHNLELHSNDRDFQRCPGLRLFNPIDGIAWPGTEPGSLHRAASIRARVGRPAGANLDI